MLIRRSHDRHGNIYPAGFNSLSSVPDHLSFHTAHQSRHPKSAYSTSIRLITAQWLKVFHEYDKLMFEHNFENKDSNESVLLSEYSQLLFRLNEHLDACISALRSLVLKFLANGMSLTLIPLQSLNYLVGKHFKNPLNLTA
jgi:hypothetical protein